MTNQYFHNPEDFVSTAEAAKLTGKSASTIRNLYKRLTDENPDMVKEENNDRGRATFYIKYSALDDHYRIKKPINTNGEGSDTSTLHADRIDAPPKFDQETKSNLAFQVARIKTENEILKSRENRPLHKTPIFWAIIIIILVVCGGFLYRYELLGNHNKELDNLKEIHSNQQENIEKVYESKLLAKDKDIQIKEISVQAKDTEIQVLKKELAEREKYYASIEKNHVELTLLQKTHINDYREQIKNLKQEMEKLKSIPDRSILETNSNHVESGQGSSTSVQSSASN